MGIGSERFAGTPRASKWLQDYEAGHSQPSRRASSPGSSHTDEMVTYSWVCGCVSRGSALVWIEKRPCHLALDAKVSKKKRSLLTQNRRYLLHLSCFASLHAAAGRDAGEQEGYFCSQVAETVAGSYKGAVARNDWRGTNHT